jgi:hypothetical protein
MTHRDRSQFAGFVMRNIDGRRAAGASANALGRKTTQRLTLRAMQNAAASLGGECLSAEYVSLRMTMRWRCAAGHEWEAQAQNARRGKWCLRCSGKMRKTIEDMQVLAHSRGGVCLSRAYKNMGTKLTWRCGCGHRWKARPHLVGQGQWCPRCANESRREKMREYAKSKKGSAPLFDPTAVGPAQLAKSRSRRMASLPSSAIEPKPPGSSRACCT